MAPFLHSEDTLSTTHLPCELVQPKLVFVIASRHTGAGVSLAIYVRYLLTVNSQTSVTHALQMRSFQKLVIEISEKSVNVN